MSIADKLQTIAENEQKVYDAGAKSEYDKFWDTYQNNGKGGMYIYRFAGYGWNDKTFKPKHDINMNGNSTSAFHHCDITDVKGILEECGVKLNTKNATSLYSAFAYSKVTRLPEINATSCSSNGLYQTFYQANDLVSIDRFIIAETNKWYGPCFYNPKLETVIFHGTMAYGTTFAGCPKLNLESLKSIITTLKDYSGTSSEFSQTLTLNSDSITILEEEGATAEYTDSEGNVTTMTWIELIDAKKWNLVSA